ncbi:MAG: TIGR03618 family F420-dependent PPOX class oxidoreductase [Solirubrobacteraceae bacterium]
MTSGRIPSLTVEHLWELLASRGHGVLATIRRDGRPQLSNIGYRWDKATTTVSFIAGDFRAKTRNLERDPRASLHVTNGDFSLWLVADGEALLSEPCRANDDQIGQLIVARFGLADGRSEAELAAHLDDYPIVGRRLIEVAVKRIYGGNATKALAISSDVELAV